MALKRRRRLGPAGRVPIRTPGGALHVAPAPGAYRVAEIVRREIMPVIRAVHDLAKRYEPGRSGKIIVKLTVLGDGTVSNVVALADTLGMPRVTSTVLKIIAQKHFDGAGIGPTEHIFPFVFMGGQTNPIVGQDAFLKLAKNIDDFDRVITKAEDSMYAGKCKQALGLLLNADRALGKAAIELRRTRSNPDKGLAPRKTRLVKTLKAFQRCVRNVRPPGIDDIIADRGPDAPLPMSMAGGWPAPGFSQAMHGQLVRPSDLARMPMSLAAWPRQGFALPARGYLVRPHGYAAMPRTRIIPGG